MLFDDGEAGDVARGTRTVRETLEGLGRAAHEVSVPDGADFVLDRDGAGPEVRLEVRGSAAGLAPRLRVVVRAPGGTGPGEAGAPDAGRLEALMRANAAGLGGLSWGLADEGLVLVGERPLRDLDASEVQALVEAVEPAWARGGG